MMQKPIHILYIEDDIGLARLLQKKLKRAGYIVDLAHDGDEGLAMYDAGSYDIVAVDQKLPNYDGLEVIRKLASRGPLPPTIMITGTGNEQIAVKAMQLGASDYIVKDVEGGYFELLPPVIEQVLNQHRLIAEKQQMFNAMQQLSRNLALLNLAGQQLVATLNLHEIVALLLQAVTETIGSEASSVWLLDEELAGGLICQAAFHYGKHQSPVNLRLPAGEGIVGWAVQNKESIIISDVQKDARFSPKIDSKTNFSTTSLLAVPLWTRGAVIGVLEVVNKLNNGFDADDQALVETLAASAAIAIDNARLIETLRQNTTELQIRNQELDAFAHTVAHDLKTPLGPLIGLAEMLKMSYTSMTSEEVQQILQSIINSGRKMHSIIDELLLLAQIRDEDVEAEPLDMATITAEAQNRLTHMAQEYQAKIVMPQTWPTGFGYGPWIEEVWVNYLSNAIKYGGQPPYLELGGAIQTNNMACFWVQDNGPGLTPEEQEQVFTPFIQLENVRAEGHGLGLSIVQRIVEKLGGQVGVKSGHGPNQGSIFSFTLPSVTHKHN